jgi:hypothetical protein
MFRKPVRRRVAQICLTGAVITLAGATATTAQAAGTERATTAPSATLQDLQLNSAAKGATDALPYAVQPLTSLRLDPLAQSAADPLTNGVALQPDGPGDTPVSTTQLTQPLSSGGGLASLPLAGTVSQAVAP